MLRRLFKRANGAPLLSNNDQIITLSDIIDILPGHVYWYDFNGIFHGCNAQQAKALGLSNSAEIRGKNLYQMQPSNDIESVKRVNDLVYQTGETQTAEETGFYNGQKLVFLSKKVPWRNRDGEIVGVIGVSFDITEEKRLKNELLFAKAHAESTLSNLLDNVSGHIYVKDPDGVYLYCNQSQAKSLKLKVENIIGKTDYDLSEKSKADQYRAIEYKVMQLRKTIIIEETATYNGNERIFLSKKAPLVDERQNIIGVVGVSIDITAEKEAEKLKREKLVAEKQAEVMKLMSAAIAHELHTPQASMDVYCTQLSKVWPIVLDRYQASLAIDCDLPKLPDALYQILKQDNMGDNLMRINNNCRTIVNMMGRNVLQGELGGQSMLFSAKRIINDAIKDFPYKSSLESRLFRGISGDNFMIIGDPDLFMHVILNLLKNAIYHVAKCGKGDIHVKLAPKSDCNMLYFEDTGPGIDPAHLDNIFDHFFTRGTDNGTGVGLALCKNVVEQNIKGKIWCESTVGEFTRFCLQLPKTDD